MIGDEARLARGDFLVGVIFLPVRAQTRPEIYAGAAASVVGSFGH